MHARSSSAIRWSFRQRPQSRRTLREYAYVNAAVATVAVATFGAECWVLELNVGYVYNIKSTQREMPHSTKPNPKRALQKKSSRSSNNTVHCCVVHYRAAAGLLLQQQQQHAHTRPTISTHAQSSVVTDRPVRHETFKANSAHAFVVTAWVVAHAAAAAAVRLLRLQPHYTRTSRQCARATSKCTYECNHIKYMDMYIHTHARTRHTHVYVYTIHPATLTNG